MKSVEFCSFWVRPPNAQFKNWSWKTALSLKINWQVFLCTIRAKFYQFLTKQQIIFSKTTIAVLTQVIMVMAAYFNLPGQYWKLLLLIYLVGYQTNFWKLFFRSCKQITKRVTKTIFRVTQWTPGRWNTWGFFMGVNQ